MSILTISQELYDRIYIDAIASLINSGHDLTSARAMAAEQMANAYLIDEDLYSTELEKDRSDDRLGLTS